METFYQSNLTSFMNLRELKVIFNGFKTFTFRKTYIYQNTKTFLSKQALPIQKLVTYHHLRNQKYKFPIKKP